MKSVISKSKKINDNKVPTMTRVEFVGAPKGYEKDYPFKKGEGLLLLGEIKNMKGHVAVVNEKGQVFWGYHTENFVINSGSITISF